MFLKFSTVLTCHRKIEQVHFTNRFYNTFPELFQDFTYFFMQLLRAHTKISNYILFSIINQTLNSRKFIQFAFSYGYSAQVSGVCKDGLHCGNLCPAWQYIRNFANCQPCLNWDLKKVSCGKVVYIHSWWFRKKQIDDHSFNSREFHKKKGAVEIN